MLLEGQVTEVLEQDDSLLKVLDVDDRHREPSGDQELGDLDER